MEQRVRPYADIESWCRKKDFDMDKTNLKSLIDESGYKLTFIAKRLGIRYETLWSKLKGKYKFDLDEIKILVDLLKIPSDKILDFF